MNILVACEFSGIVRDAFMAKGHNVISCDLLSSDRPGPHYQGNVLDLIKEPFDLVIAHPTCTRLANSGSLRLYKGGKKENGIDPDKWIELLSAIEFFNKMFCFNSAKIVIENPVMHCHARERIIYRYNQIIQPYWFGENAKKATCLWLKGLAPLRVENMIYPVNGRYGNQTISGQNNLPPGLERAKLRSVTYQGIANAMANQWG